MAIVLNKGVALMMKGMYEEGIACYDRVLSGDPRNVSALFNKAVALGNLGRREDMLRGLEATMSVGGDSAKGRVEEILSWADATEEERRSVMNSGRAGAGGRRKRKGRRGRT